MTPLDRLEALEKAATARPWETRRWPHRATGVIGPADPERPNYRFLVTPKEAAMLAVEARNLLPTLIAVARAALDVSHIEATGVLPDFQSLADALAPLLDEGDAR